MGKRKGAGVFLSSPFPLQNLQTYNNSSFVQFPEFQIERQKKPASSAQILFNPVSRQDILRFPESRTVFWPNPRSQKYPFKPCVIAFTNLTIFR